ncbi:MAG TPA: stage II sporulation protein M [Candidatus Obscuribacterales bacterium]
MNVERWLKSRKPSWERLEALLKRADSKGVQELDRLELQELGRLYRMTSADLSRARALKLGQNIEVFLNNLVVKAHNQVYQTPRNRWADLGNFLWISFPRLVRSRILYVAAAFALFMIPAAMSYAMTVKDAHFAQLEVAHGHPLVSDEMWNMIENHQMWTDSVQGHSQTASSMIATNNIRVCILSFVFGISYGLGTAFVLFNNGLSIGTVLGLCKVYGMADRLLAFVAPHGVLELSAIFISGGAGLLIGRSLLFPGRYSRIDAFKLVARDAGGLFGGCVPLLLVAGMIEGFISPRTDLTPDMKFAVSLATLVLLMLYLFVPRGEEPANGNTVEQKL